MTTRPYLLAAVEYIPISEVKVTCPNLGNNADNPCNQEFQVRIGINTTRDRGTLMLPLSCPNCNMEYGDAEAEQMAAEASEVMLDLLHKNYMAQPTIDLLAHGRDLYTMARGRASKYLKSVGIEHDAISEVTFVKSRMTGSDAVLVAYRVSQDTSSVVVEGDVFEAIINRDKPVQLPMRVDA